MDRNDQSGSQPDGSPLETDLPDEAKPAPTVSCSVCDEEWELSYELTELHAGNRAIEQFALDHCRHTGHYPDDIAPWTVSCEDCQAEERYLEQRPAKRFGKTHVRHTGHSVSVDSPTQETHQIEPSTVPAHESE
ncbi:hypothetical protein ACFQJ7_13185 [Halovenus rubra]|uniref:Uncharacterized protein n=2 Tax=Halovenus rubra TaxID=869890 RepID=A0ACC7DYP3_9EURY|nr:hypothetical protein [Halovenus rubra]